jgi:hypothetical protein
MQMYRRHDNNHLLMLPAGLSSSVSCFERKLVSSMEKIEIIFYNLVFFSQIAKNISNEYIYKQAGS